MTLEPIERYAKELDERRRAQALVGLGLVTVGHGVSLDFEEAVRSALAELEALNRRHQRGAWIDAEHERQVWADISHLHWMALFRDSRH